MSHDDNAILNFSELPRFAEIRPQHAAAAVDSSLAALSAATDAAAVAVPEWDLMWLPLESADESVARVWNQIEHMHSVMSVPEWREAHRQNLNKVAAHYAKMGQHEGLYANLLKLLQAPGLSPTQRKILSDARRDFELSGVGLPADKKTQFRQNSEHLAELSAKFEDNLLDATNDNAMMAAAADLGEMPEDIKRAAQTADGDYRFSLLPPSYAAFMQYSPARDKKRQMYYDYHTRASEFGPAVRDNSPLIDEILKLRHAQATTLGFANYAELALQKRMAVSPMEVVDFLQDLAAKALPHARRELQELREFAAAELQIDDLQAWDFAYASDQFRRHRFDFSAAELRPYLQVSRVLEGLFACISQLFGATLSAAATPTWLSGVQYLQVSRGGEVVGGLYLDLYSRDTKRGGAWMAESLSRCWRGGKLQLPVAHVVCNFTPPVDDSAALMSWEEAQTLFHEFGHALHHVLTEVEEYSVSGMGGVEWDAVELPSQLMENFIWDWRVLSSFSAMPQELFLRARAARRFQGGLHLMRQIEFALFDLSLHSGAAGGFMAVLSEIQRQTAVLSPPEWGRFPCGFSHIFAGGYAAGYYSYLWAEVLAADIFAMFEESGDVLNAELGGRFRREILAAGGSRPAMESFMAMRGRSPKADALLRAYGLGD